ncbi:MAG: class I SAM-dependent methyltransferase [Planctomycetes bacterium]|jgi:SAM-dependent methyltransferase|nr:class I SAM-dependent methyltransferase [Planctomycetota bacterium]
MISTDGFKMSKRMAQLALGPSGKNSYVYWSDVRRQWEWSYANNKIVSLIGSQSMPPENLDDVRNMLGELSSQEKDLELSMRGIYTDLARLLTTVPAQAAFDCDLYETLLDLRIVGEAIRRPCRVLDIGPGAGRHMAAMCLDPIRRGGLYVGIESVGMCYSLQNMLASLISIKSPNVTFLDELDYQFARKDLPPMNKCSPKTIYHLPLWRAHLLPKRFFDVILCNYILDELSGDDFMRVMQIIGRCLGDEGILYCRGSQQRSMLGSMYVFGYGRFHGIDITKSLLSNGLRVLSADLVASQLTRTFVRTASKTYGAATGRYARFTKDSPLVEQAQKDFIAEQIKSIGATTCVVWGDAGYSAFNQHVLPHLNGVKIAAVTNRQAGEIPNTQFNCPQIPVAHLPKLDPQAVIIASMQERSIHRQLNEMMPSKPFDVFRTFNHPVAFARRRHDREQT